MNYETFLAHLRPEQGWRTCGNGSLLTTKNECVWVRVVRDTDRNEPVYRDGKDITPDIYRANDNASDADPALRRDLLLACGLKPQEAATP